MSQIWKSLKLIKGKLKSLHIQEFRGVKDKVNACRAILCQAQDALKLDIYNPELF